MEEENKENKTPLTIDMVVPKLEIRTENRNVKVEEGHELIRNLKKEAKRQKEMKYAINLEKQTRAVENLPSLPSIAEEISLAGSFEIYEE